MNTDTAERVRVRLELRNGRNKGRYLVEHLDTGKQWYVNRLILHDAIPIAKLCAAKRIQQGKATKHAVAWIYGDYVEISLHRPVSFRGYDLKYNPKVSPYWRCNGEEIKETTTFSRVLLDKEANKPVITVED